MTIPLRKNPNTNAANVIGKQKMSKSFANLKNYSYDCCQMETVLK
jgi:hypothetical protein